eukprot:gene28261-31364_t
MLLHSMCQPGRPGPQGLGQEGSPGLAPFHNVKILGSPAVQLSGSPPGPWSTWFPGSLVT